MKMLIPIFEFVAKKRSFAFLFVLFGMLYLCGFVILILNEPETIADISKFQIGILGLILSSGGGLFAALAFKFVSWRTRLQIENYSRELE